MLRKRIILLFCLFTAFLSNAQERIYSFDAHLKVKEDASLIVTEKIKIRAEGKVFKRGIFRSLPLYRNINKRKIRVKYTIVSISRDGQKEPYFTKEEGDSFYIYIGNKNKYLPKGKYTYSITYSSERQIGYFGDYDELYWNVNGFQWDFPIQRVSAKVSLPNAAEILQKACYTGKVGSSEQRCSVKQKTANTIYFEAKNLATHENLTIAVGFPKGIVSVVTNNSLGISLPSLAILLLSLFGGYGFFTWRTFGKGQRKPTPYPQFAPPNNMSPAYMNYILKEKVDTENSFTASVINLAIKGYIYIEEISKKNLGLFPKKIISLNLIKKADKNLPKEERMALNKLFTNGKTEYILDGSPDGILRYVLSDYKKSLKTQLKPLIKQGGNRLMVIVPILLFLGFLVGAYFVDNTFTIMLVVAVIVGLLVSVFFLGLVVFRIFRRLRPQTEMKIHKIFGLLCCTFIYFFLMNRGGALDISAILFYVICVVFVWGIFHYAHIIRKRPVELLKMQSDIEGFRMYLGAAEEKQLQMFNPPKMTPEIFEKLLPYAIVLGVGKIWGKRFEKMVEFGGMPNSDNTDDYWYRGNQTVTASALATHLSSSLSSSVSRGSANTSSDDSGSDGGGYSGGGGGGGGGGGW